MVKNLPEDAGDTCSIPGSGRSPGGGKGNPLQYLCLENSMDRGTWRATVHGVTKQWTQLGDSACTLHSELKHHSQLAIPDYLPEQSVNCFGWKSVFPSCKEFQDTSISA